MAGPNLARRRFLGGLVLGPASITASATVSVRETQHGAVEFLNPMCPSCCALFDVTALIPLGPNESFGDRATRGCKPMDVTCRCEWQGQITFFRRQG